MSDEALFSCIAGVFNYINNQWAPIDGGSSKVWIMYNSQNNIYRIVACSNTNSQFVCNSTLTKDVAYQKATDVFLQWRDAVKVYGLFFSKFCSIG